MKGYIEYEKMVYSEQSSYRLGESARGVMRLSPSQALQALHTVEEWDAAMKEVFATMEENTIQKEEALFATIESVPQGLSPQQMIWILFMKGAVYELKRKLDKAEAVYLHMEELSEEIGDAKARSYSLKGLGNVAFKRSKFAVANRYYNKCQKIAEPLHDDLLSSDVLNNLGSCLFMDDDVEGALDHFTQALDLIGADQSREAFILCNQGLCYARMEQLENARKLWEKSLHLYEDVHDTVGMQIVRHNLREIDQRQKKEYLEQTYQKAMETGTTEDRKKAYEDLVKFQIGTYMEKGGMSS
jgi:tetratricopeptide (TPR) repeat protein